MHEYKIEMFYYSFSETEIRMISMSDELIELCEVGEFA